jgi:uncharacterized protein YegJ (DUF2314 family)
LLLTLLTPIGTGACGKSDKATEGTRDSETSVQATTTVAPATKPIRYSLELWLYTEREHEALAPHIEDLTMRLEAAGWRPKVTLASASEYPHQDDEYIQGFLTSAELLKAKQATSVVHVALETHSKEMQKKFKAAHAAILAEADLLDAFVWDQGSWSMYTASAWASAHEQWSQGAPFALEHLTVQLDRDDKGERLVTVGLGKFGLPELLVENASPGNRARTNALLNLIAQGLIEGSIAPGESVTFDVSKLQNSAARDHFDERRGDGGKGLIQFGLAMAEKTPTDPQGKILTIDLRGSGSTESQREISALDAFFGEFQSAVNYFKKPSALWKAASAKSLKRLSELRPRFQLGLKPKETLFVKARLEDPAGRAEWMWVDVLSWKGPLISGRLASEPRMATHLKPGQELTLQESEVADFLFTSADGQQEGNHTGKTYWPEWLSKTKGCPADVVPKSFGPQDYEALVCDDARFGECLAECKSGHANYCHAVASSSENPDELDEMTTALYARGCALGNVSACTNWVARRVAANPDVGHTACVSRSFDVICGRAKDPWACTMLAIGLSQNNAKENEQRIRELVAAACEAGDEHRACTEGRSLLNEYISESE